MAQLIKHINAYSKITYKIAFDERLSYMDKGLFSVLCTLPDDWDFNVKGLQKIADNGRESIETSLKRLEKFGYLRRTQTRDTNGRMSSVVYDLYDEPYSESINGTTVSRCTVNGFPVSGKTATNISNTIINTNNIKLNNKQELNKEKENTKRKDLDLSFIESSFSEAFNMWLEYKRERKESYKTQTSVEICYKNLLKLSSNNAATAREIVEQSIGNNWSGLFPLKNKMNNGTTSTSTRDTTECSRPISERTYDPSEYIFHHAK